jgi:hypothetical protein
MADCISPVVIKTENGKTEIIFLVPGILIFAVQTVLDS